MSTNMAASNYDDKILIKTLRLDKKAVRAIAKMTARCALSLSIYIYIHAL